MSLYSYKLERVSLNTSIHQCGRLLLLFCRIRFFYDWEQVGQCCHLVDQLISAKKLCTEYFVKCADGEIRIKWSVNFISKIWGKMFVDIIFSHHKDETTPTALNDNCDPTCNIVDKKRWEKNNNFTKISRWFCQIKRDKILHTVTNKHLARCQDFNIFNIFWSLLEN